MQILLLLLLLLNGVRADFDAPRYDLDLDAPAKERWKVPMLEQIAKHGWENSYGPIFTFINGVFPSAMWHQYDDLLRSVAEPIIGHEFVEELAGIVEVAQAIGQNVTMSELEFFQIFYEILMQCTGVLALNDHDELIHGRNMDIGLPVENITMQVAWQKGGKTVFTSTQFLGYVGVHTGMRHDGWSVQANERVVLAAGPEGYELAILLQTALAFAEGHEPVGKFLRRVLLESPMLADALPALKSTPLASPMYIITGGLSNGVVITRDRDGLAQKSQDTSVFGEQPIPPGAQLVNLSKSEPTPEKWWVVQTNWDPWIEESHASCDVQMKKMTAQEEEACEAYIKKTYGDGGQCSDLCQLYSDGRAEAGRASMSSGVVKRTSGQMEIDIFDSVMSIPPVLAGGTKFTSIMSASHNIYETMVRESSSNSSDAVPSEAVAKALRFFIRALANIPGL